MNNPMKSAAAYYDPTLPQVVRNPYPALLALQRHDPAHWNPKLKAWVLTRYDDVLSMNACLRQRKACCPN